MASRYRTWSFFYALCALAIGSYVFWIANHKTLPLSRVGVMLSGLVFCLVGVRMLVASGTGRVPKWLVRLIDSASD